MTEPRINHCLGGCGDYATDKRAIKDGWHPSSDREHVAGAWRPCGYTCPRCRKAALQARVRAALQNGVRLGTKDLSPAEREAAAQVLGPELLETVDGGWGEERRETPPYGVPMGVALPEIVPVPGNTFDFATALASKYVVPSRESLLFELTAPYREFLAQSERIAQSMYLATTSKDQVDRLAEYGVFSYADRLVRQKEHMRDPLFYELSVMYERCRAAAPDFHIQAHGPRQGEMTMGRYAAFGSTFDAVWSDGKGRFTMVPSFDPEPTWESLRSLLAQCIAILDPAPPLAIRVRQVS